MTLQLTGPISASDINIELGRASDANFSIDGVDERALAGIPSGAISISDFYGKSLIDIAILINTSTILTQQVSSIFAICTISILSDGTITRTNGSDYLWVDALSVGDFDGSLYRCRLTKTSGSSNDVQLQLDVWVNLGVTTLYSIINNVESTIEDFVGVLTIEEIANPSNFDTVIFNMTSERLADGEFPQ